MSIIATLRSGLARAIAPAELRNWMNQDATLKRVSDSWAAGPTAAGLAINERTALNCSAVWSAVNVIASSVASLPLFTYRTDANGDRQRATSSDVYWVLHDQPNSEMTPYYFWETLMVHVLLTGNGYAEIQRTQSGRIDSLWPINPFDIKPVRVEGKLAYEYKGGRIDASKILHIPGLGFDGLQGYSPVTVARESIALGIATEKFGASFFGNGAWPGLVIKSEKTLSADAQTRLREGVNKLHQGAEKGHKAFVLEEGMTIDKMSITPEDSQFLQTRVFQVEEIARWFRVPPHKLMHKVGERPGGNLESQNAEFLTDTLRPWLARIEQECERKLIPYRERPQMFCEFLVEGILRADTQARYSAYSIGIDKGWLSVNEVRRRENLNGIGAQGDSYKGLTEAQAAPTADASSDSRAVAFALAQRGVAKDAFGRLVRAEIGQLRKAVERNSSFEDVYAKHTAKMVEVLRPVLAAHDALTGKKTDIHEFVRAYTDYALVALTDPAANVEETLSEWEQNRADSVVDALFASEVQ